MLVTVPLSLSCKFPENRDVPALLSFDTFIHLHNELQSFVLHQLSHLPLFATGVLFFNNPHPTHTHFHVFFVCVTRWVWLFHHIGFSSVSLVPKSVPNREKTSNKLVLTIYQYLSCSGSSKMDGFLKKNSLRVSFFFFLLLGSQSAVFMEKRTNAIS